MLQWLPVLVYAGLIFYLSAQPYLTLPGGLLLVIDPEMFVFHLFEYIPLGFLAARAASKTPMLSLRNSRPFSMFIGAAYGLSDELHQYFVPGRTASPLDAMADTIGVAFGVFIWGILMDWRHKL